MTNGDAFSSDCISGDRISFSLRFIVLGVLVSTKSCIVSWSSSLKSTVVAIVSIRDSVLTVSSSDMSQTSKSKRIVMSSLNTQMVYRCPRYDISKVALINTLNPLK